GEKVLRGREFQVDHVGVGKVIADAIPGHPEIRAVVHAGVRADVEHIVTVARLAEIDLQRVGRNVGEVAADVGPAHAAVDRAEDLPAAEAIAHGVGDVAVDGIDHHVDDVVIPAGDVAPRPRGAVVGGDVSRAVGGGVNDVGVARRRRDGVDHAGNVPPV